MSSAWRSEIWDSGREIAEEILSLGVQAMELEYRMTRSMLKEVHPLVKAGRMAVTSLHNILPLPSGIPKNMANGEFVSLSSPDENERKSALRYALKTMEWAEKFGARAIVLHMGKAYMSGAMEFLMEMYDRGMTGTEEGRALIEGHKTARARLGRPLLEAALKSLEILAKEGEKRGISWGIENRYKVQDFPNFEEFKAIFREFQGSSIRYWHDMGHATTQENLGLTPRGILLENFGDLLLGVHLHGCRGYEDHYAPGTGEEDYSLLKRYLKAETIRVVETHHRATRKELLQGLAFLRDQGIAKPPSP
jgi:sugar phosphate isomerase/epimerase